MGVWEVLVQKVSGSSNGVQAIDRTSDKSQPSQPTIADTKAKDLLAFRTIITLLSCIQSPNTELAKTGPIGTVKGDRDELRVLDALSAILIRQHEITAVVARPYDGSNLQVFASIAYSSNAEPLPQPDAEPGIQGFWNRVYNNYTVAVNPRDTRVNGHTDSLVNRTSLPYIGDHQDKLPGELVTAAEQNAPVLDIFLKNHWGQESFETHVWMLKTLLGRSSGSSEDTETFLLYSIAVSFEKMNARMTNKQISAPYLRCLQKQTTLPFTNISTVVPKAGDSNADKPFIQAIPFLAKHTETKIPNLQHAANLAQPTEVYNKNTYMEFHLLLCELISKFGTSLTELKAVQKNQKGNRDFVLEALKKIRVFGHFLRIMVRSSAIEKHLQNIAPFLVVDSRKMWTPEPGGSEDADFADFHSLKPYSMRKGKPLLPWESYRDWLKLMVHYFDAAQVLVAHVASWSQSPNPLSITILSPPLPRKDMLPWNDLLETERFFPTLPGESSGKDFISFLTKSCKEDIPDTKSSIREVAMSARMLTQQLESDLDSSMDSLTKINALTQQVKKCSSVGRKNDIDRIVEKLVDLKDSEPQDRLARIQVVVEMLDTLTKRATFYDNLRQGPLSRGQGFSGKHHCEAYTASLLTLSIGQHDDFEERLKLSEKEIEQLKALLIELQGCRHTIGVSKRCCPVCAFLLQLLNKHCKAKFVISDEHTNITSCALPGWLPGDIVYLMVVEFSRRLRKELTKLQESTSELRGQAGTSDTGRFSMESIRTMEHGGIVEADAVQAFRAVKP